MAFLELLSRKKDYICVLSVIIFTYLRVNVAMGEDFSSMNFTNNPEFSKKKISSVVQHIQMKRVYCHVCVHQSAFYGN
jgi:hypothetical protein